MYDNSSMQKRDENTSCWDMMTVSWFSPFSAFGFSSLLSSQLPPDTSDPPRSKSLMQCVLKKPYLLKQMLNIWLVIKKANGTYVDALLVHTVYKSQFLAWIYKPKHQCLTCTCFYKADPRWPSRLACDPPEQPAPELSGEYFWVGVSQTPLLDMQWF